MQDGVKTEIWHAQIVGSNDPLELFCKRGSFFSGTAVAFADGFPSGRIGVYSSVAPMRFDSVRLYDPSAFMDLLGRWSGYAKNESGSSTSTINAVDSSQTPDYLLRLSVDQRLPVLLKGLRYTRFQATFSVKRLNSTDTNSSVGLVFNATDQDDFDKVRILHQAGVGMPTGWSIDNGGVQALVASTSTDATKVVHPAGTDKLWVRVTNDGTTLSVFEAASQSGLDTAVACYTSANFNNTGGMIGFSPESGGGYVGDVSVKRGSGSPVTYSTTDAADAFTVDGSGYATDTLTYDNAGNLTYDGVFQYAYDAWNRLITVSKAYRDGSGVHAGSLIDTMSYDGMGRRISKAVDNSGDWDCAYHCYYDGQSLVESRNGNDNTLKQHLWGLGYIDELVQIATNDDPTDTNERVCESKYWACCDANYNVLGVVDSSGVVIERYEYTPYGQRQVFIRSGTNDTGCYAATAASKRVVTDSGTVTQPYGLCEVGHQGLVHDEDVGAVFVRARNLSCALGRLIQRDAEEYMEPPNAYVFGSANSVTHLDPSGHTSIGFAFDAFIGSWHKGPDAPWLGEPKSVLNGSAPSDLSEFLGDNRGFGKLQKNPVNARLASFGFIESTKIGVASGSDVGGLSYTGFSRRRERTLLYGDPQKGKVYGPWTNDPPKQATVEGNPVAQITNIPPCETKVSFNPSSAYPYLGWYTPKIDYLVIFDFKCVSAGTIKVTISGWTNRFPDYEAYAGIEGDHGLLRWVSQAPDPGPSIKNLTSSYPIPVTTFTVSAP